jgi:phage-related protein
LRRRWRYYRTPLGREVVKEELKDLNRGARAAVVEAMKRHQASELKPYEEEHIGGDLHAIRVFLDGSTYRLLYAYEGRHDQVLLALHCLQKRDRKLPKQARKLAERRLSDWRSRAAGAGQVTTRVA